MAQEILSSVTCNVMLENGTDTSGNIKTVKQSIGKLSKDRWNADKALAIVTALAPCLSKTVNAVHEVDEKKLVAS